jgi:lysophospholipase L1-like esterase
MKIKRKSIYIIVTLLIALTTILFLSNNVNKKMDLEIYKKLKVINRKNIYFGHRSLGENIIEGLKKVNSDHGENNLIINELKDNTTFDGNYFVHSNIGHNGDPQSKFEEFTKIVNYLANKNLDIAMMKLCFVDITRNTDIDYVFKSYVTMIDSIKNKYPDLTIIHFTVPLKSKSSWIDNLKDKIKDRNNNDLQDNLARNRYNERLLSKYSIEDIFDLAGIESTYPNGERESIFVDGKPCYFLIKDYSEDGGHLNVKGKQLVAEKIINKIYERINLLIAK